MELPDVQANKPEVGVNLTRVGVKDVKKLVEVARKGKRPIILVSNFDISVDLPRNIKGVNLSRNFEVVYDVLEEAVSSPIYEIEELCSEVARRLLDCHRYASTADVKLSSEYIIKRRTPITRMQCQEVANIFGEAKAIRDGERTKVRKMIGAEVIGMTTCPCAQEIIKEEFKEELYKLGVEKDKMEKLMNMIPFATHNQRGHGSIFIEVDDKEKVSLDKIIRIIESSMSSTVYELLKRVDEAYIVRKAHRKPMFAEDCVREMAKKVVEEFSYLGDNAIVKIRQVNEESIHRHNAFAERIAYLGELRREIEEYRWE